MYWGLLNTISVWPYKFYKLLLKKLHDCRQRTMQLQMGFWAQRMLKTIFCEWALGRQKWPDGTIVCRRCSVSWKKNPATRSDKVTFLLIAIRGGDFLLHVREKKNLICCFLQELRYSFKVCKKYFSYADFFVWEHEGRKYEHKWINKFHSKHILVSIFCKKILWDWKN